MIDSGLKVGDTPLTRKKAPAKKPAKAKAKTVKASSRKSAKPKTKKVAARPRKAPAQSELLKRIVASLEDDKAEAIVTIDLEGRSSLCDAAVIASGRSSRHVMAIAEHL
ncbi:MAG TPA: RsfS/YbeB/iojap family protein, partial [Rhizomicrobium sp.]|nr:RsfS/YbeB/iojap family protein [Rhizomicrobium sp.]